MTDYVEAATSLVKTLNAPPQAHSVYIKTETTAGGDFTRKICVSWHPKYKGDKNLPAEHMGYPIEVTPWPKGM